MNAAKVDASQVDAMQIDAVKLMPYVHQQWNLQVVSKMLAAINPSMSLQDHSNQG